MTQLIVPSSWSLNTVYNTGTTTLQHHILTSGIVRKHFQHYDQQQIYLRKSKLKMVIVFLAAAISFGQ